MTPTYSRGRYSKAAFISVDICVGATTIRRGRLRGNTVIRLTYNDEAVLTHSDVLTK